MAVSPVDNAVKGCFIYDIHFLRVIFSNKIAYLLSKDFEVYC